MRPATPLPSAQRMVGKTSPLQLVGMVIIEAAVKGDVDDAGGADVDEVDCVVVVSDVRVEVVPAVQVKQPADNSEWREDFQSDLPCRSCTSGTELPHRRLPAVSKYLIDRRGCTHNVADTQ